MKGKGGPPPNGHESEVWPRGGAAMARRNLVAGLDVGTTKVLALVADVEDGHVNVIGVGTSPSRGLRKGIVVDIESTVRAVQEAVQKAQRMSGYPIRSVFLSVAGGHISSHNNRGVVAVTSRDREITSEDVARVLEAARVISMPSDREIVHVLPRQYVVDGYEGVRDPVGMIGSRLEVEAHIVTGATTTMQNLLRSVEKAGIEVEGMVFAPLAAGESVLTEDERELGVVLADVGGGTTDVAIYSDGSMVHSTVLPMGGEYITTDIAVMLRTSLAQAEVVKIDYGCAVPDLVDASKVFPVPGVGGQGFHEVSAKMLSEIIEARLREILAAVGQVVRESGYGRTVPGGVVLTGGVAATRGIVELGMDELDMPVRVGLPDNLGGLQDMAAAPSFAVGVGLLYHAAGLQEVAAAHERRHHGGWANLATRLRGWFRELF